MAFGLLVALAVLFTTSASFADDWREHGGGSSYQRTKDQHYSYEQRYDYQSAYRGHARHDFNRPTSKLYKIGRPLPSYVAYRPVPRSMLRHLRPAPAARFMLRWAATS